MYSRRDSFSPCNKSWIEWKLFWRLKYVSGKISTWYGYCLKWKVFLSNTSFRSINLVRYVDLTLGKRYQLIPRSTNFLWMTKPYTNSWQTSKISLNLGFFYVRNWYHNFQIWSKLVLSQQKLQAPIFCGLQIHIPTLGKIQE